MSQNSKYKTPKRTEHFDRRNFTVLGAHTLTYRRRSHCKAPISADAEWMDQWNTWLWTKYVDVDIASPFIFGAVPKPPSTKWRNQSVQLVCLDSDSKIWHLNGLPVAEDRGPASSSKICDWNVGLVAASHLHGCLIGVPACRTRHQVKYVLGVACLFSIPVGALSDQDWRPQSCKPAAGGARAHNLSGSYGGFLK